MAECRAPVIRGVDAVGLRLKGRAAHPIAVMRRRDDVRRRQGAGSADLRRVALGRRRARLLRYPGRGRRGVRSIRRCRRPAQSGGNGGESAGDPTRTCSGVQPTDRCPLPRLPVFVLLTWTFQTLNARGHHIPPAASALTAP